MATTIGGWEFATITRASVSVDARRKLQLALGGMWLYAGLLQAQSYMFTRSFSAQMLDGAGQGNPRWLASTIHWNASLLAAHPLFWNLLFMLIQVALGLGIAYRPTVKLALAASIGWSVMVWWLGEGLGGLLTGHANAINGAPGAVILYAILAVLLWPTDRPGPGESAPFVAARAIGPTSAKWIWALLWIGLALLNLQPGNGGPDGISTLIANSGSGQPEWITATVHAFGEVSRGNGVWLGALMASLLVLIALGIWFPRPIARSAVIVGGVVAVLIWLVGEELGTPFGGQTTDPNSGPLLLLMAVAFWPRTNSVEVEESEATRS